MGLSGPQVQPVLQSVPSPYFQDPENGSEKELHDLGMSATRDGGTDLSIVTDPGSYEHQPGKEPLSFSTSHGKDPNPQGHWWQVGILSNFTLSKPRSNNSDI